MMQLYNSCGAICILLTDTTFSEIHTTWVHIVSARQIAELVESKVAQALDQKTTTILDQILVSQGLPAAISRAYQSKVIYSSESHKYTISLRHKAA